MHRAEVAEKKIMVVCSDNSHESPLWSAFNSNTNYPQFSGIFVNGVSGLVSPELPLASANVRTSESSFLSL